MQFVKLLTVFLCVLSICTIAASQGFTCGSSGDCCGTIRLSGSTIDMPCASGTNCKNNQIVMASECPAGSCRSAAPPASATTKPISTPTVAPTPAPTQKATAAPTVAPTPAPTQKATAAPTAAPTPAPTQKATAAPTAAPTPAPTQKATVAPTPTQSSGCSLSQIFSLQDFNTLFPYANGAAKRGDANQHAIFNYTYLLDAAKQFPSFACTGDLTTRKRELAAFLAQTSQETSGWWSGQPYNWGFFFSTEVGCTASTCSYCSGASGAMACAPGQGYYGRGPIQLSWNYNYYQASMAIFGTPILLTQPDQIFAAGGTAFKTALWFWMTPQSPKPSAHDVMTGAWIPNAADKYANRYPGFGMVTNIVNGGLECNPSATAPLNRIGYFNAYTQYFGISMGDNVSCANQMSF